MFSKCKDSYSSSKVKWTKSKLCLSSSHEELHLHPCIIISSCLKYFVLEIIQWCKTWRQLIDENKWSLNRRHFHTPAVMKFARTTACGSRRRMRSISEWPLLHRRWRGSVLPLPGGCRGPRAAGSVPGSPRRGGCTASRRSCSSPPSHSSAVGAREAFTRRTVPGPKRRVRRRSCAQGGWLCFEVRRCWQGGLWCQDTFHPAVSISVQSSWTIPVNSRSALILLMLLMVYFPQTIGKQLSSLWTATPVVHWTACSLVTELVNNSSNVQLHFDNTECYINGVGLIRTFWKFCSVLNFGWVLH